jgi:hypothetical protein
MQLVISTLTIMIGTLLLTLFRWPVVYAAWWILGELGNLPVGPPTPSGSLSIALVSVFITIVGGDPFSDTATDDEEDQNP